MKEAFISKRFHSESMGLIGTINRILDDYERQGYALSLRQLYYQLVARALIENTEKSYKNIGNLVSDARLAGMIDWSMIKDRGRNTTGNSHWESVDEIIRESMYAFKVDMWKNQPCYVELMVEKQALEGVLEPVCRELDIPFTANKGYSSSTAMYEASKRYVHAAEAGKTLHMLYLGDHDPSGIDMTRDVDDRFQLFIATTLAGDVYTREGLEDLNRDHQVHRLALNMDQVRKYHPPENPAKLTDTRANDYIKRFGHASWELDALEPTILASLVKKAVENLIDAEIWDEDLKRQLAGRNELQAFADTYRGSPEEEPPIEGYTNEERPNE